MGSSVQTQEGPPLRRRLPLLSAASQPPASPSASPAVPLPPGSRGRGYREEAGSHCFRHSVWKGPPAGHSPTGTGKVVWSSRQRRGRTSRNGRLESAQPPELSHRGRKNKVNDTKRDQTSLRPLVTLRTASGWETLGGQHPGKQRQGQSPTLGKTSFCLKNPGGQREPLGELRCGSRNGGVRAGRAPGAGPVLGRR